MLSDTFLYLPYLMKRILLILSLMGFAATVFTSFRDHAAQPTSSPASEISTDYLRDLRSFAQAAQQLLQQAESLDENTVHDLQKTFKRTRNTYKRTEYLAEYLDGEFVQDFINGPPLLSLERNAPSLSVLEPEGLQVLEELIFGEDPVSEKTEIVRLVKALQHNLDTFQKGQRRIMLTDRQVLEAARFELIRIFTLGVTGFDSPAALFSLPEAHTSLKSIQQALLLYEPLLMAKDRQLANYLKNELAHAVRYLADHQDFDQFDRLTFLKEYINPLYKTVLDVQMTLGIETYYETNPQGRKQSVNYFAENIFAEDFLNPFFYTRMAPEKYEPEVISLGQTLFFDPILSDNNQRSCASCHQPGKAFTDGLPKSLANDEGTVDRNAPTLLNAAYAERYFYDLRTDVLEDQIDHVVTDHREFYTNYLDIFEELGQSEEYLKQFREAFPEIKQAPITKYSLSTALAAYIVSLKSFNSPFDQYVRGESNDLSTSAKRGFNLFMGKAACGTCHFAPLFNGTVPPLYHESESEVLGVPATPDTLHPTLDSDWGRAGGVLKEQVGFYQYSFKTTTVRNAALTAPYMHNGVYPTLAEVVDFYNRGGGQGLGLTVPYQTLSPDPLNLSQQEQADLVAFMESLTDTTAVHQAPHKLPTFAGNDELNQRQVGGTY